MEVRKVYANNLADEFRLIGEVLCYNKGSYVAVDTEFPGIVHKLEKPYFYMTNEDTYSVLRKNVNDLKLIQLGLSISDYNETYIYSWEFNFREFDVENDPQDKESVAMLKKQGINFEANRETGISVEDFKKAFLESWLGNYSSRILGEEPYSPGAMFRADFYPKLTWVFFHSTYDIGYLIRMLTGKPLPAKLKDFMELVWMYLGYRIYDFKEMIKDEPFGRQGLDKIAASLNVGRIGGQSHLAGSDSLLTLCCFFVWKAQQRQKGLADFDLQFNYKLHGLQAQVPEYMKRANDQSRPLFLQLGNLTFPGYLFK